MAGEKKRILVVDDDHDTRLVLSTIAARAGYQVDAVADGGMALTMVQAKSPDLILLDAKLPRQSGYDVCRTIRAHAKGKHIPVVMITGEEETDSRDQALAAGADEMLQKPIRAEDVLEVIEQLMKISEARAQLDMDPGKVAKTFGRR